MSKYSIERSKGQCIKSFRSRKSGLTNSRNLVELLQHRVKGGDKNLENKPHHHHDIFFQFRFIFVFVAYTRPFKANCDIIQAIVFHVLQHGWYI